MYNTKIDPKYNRVVLTKDIGCCGSPTYPWAILQTPPSFPPRPGGYSTPIPTPDHQGTLRSWALERRFDDQGKEVEPAYSQFPSEPSESPKIYPAHEFLEKAGETMKARAQLRDAAAGERSMAKIVATFNALTGHTLSEAEGWEFMVLLKMVRGRQGKFNDDDYTDGAAYFALLGECESNTRGK